MFSVKTSISGQPEGMDLIAPVMSDGGGGVLVDVGSTQWDYFNNIEISHYATFYFLFMTNIDSVLDRVMVQVRPQDLIFNWS